MHRICMGGVRIAGQAREHDDIGFGDGAAGAHCHVANFEFLNSFSHGFPPTFSD